MKCSNCKVGRAKLHKCIICEAQLCGCCSINPAGQPAKIRYCCHPNEQGACAKEFRQRKQAEGERVIKKTGRIGQSNEYVEFQCSNKARFIAQRCGMSDTWNVFFAQGPVLRVLKSYVGQKGAMRAAQTRAKRYTEAIKTENLYFPKN